MQGVTRLRSFYSFATRCRSARSSMSASGQKQTFAIFEANLTPRCIAAAATPAFAGVCPIGPPAHEKGPQVWMPIADIASVIRSPRPRARLACLEHWGRASTTAPLVALQKATATIAIIGFSEISPKARSI